MNKRQFLYKAFETEWSKLLFSEKLLIFLTPKDACKFFYIAGAVLGAKDMINHLEKELKWTHTNSD